MNENLQKALAEILESALAAKDFIVSETPEVIQQLLTYNFTMSIIQTVCGIILWLLLIPLYKISRKLENDAEGTYMTEVPTIIGTVVGVVMVLLGCALTFNLTWLKIWLAPKVYLIEYMTDIVKNNT